MVANLHKWALNEHFCQYRVYPANTPIKNRHFSASEKVREILKTILCSYVNAILYVIDYVIANGF